MHFKVTFGGIMIIKKFLLVAGVASTIILSVNSAQAVSLDKDRHSELATGVTQSFETRSGVQNKSGSGVQAKSKSAVQAVALITGNEFAVASSSGYPDPTPTHFHSDDGNSQSVGTDWMEVGECCGDGSDEEVRGMAEFDMSSAFTVDNASISFEVAQLTGLFSQPGPGDFTIEVVTYVGDNVESLSDYNIASTSTVTSFGTSGLSVGQYFSFDVTAVYNAAASANAAAFGIRLQPISAPNGAAVVFGNAALGLAVNPPLPPLPQDTSVPTNTPLGLIALMLLIAAVGFTAVQRRTTR
jgi:hypothetical protein